PASLDVKILDDAPVAADDTDTLAFGDTTASGNVIDGTTVVVDGDTVVVGADTAGADGANVTAIAFGSNKVTVDPVTGTATIHGTYG
ncbi:hypothetical protein L9G16_21860, partial [Shewanella sp. A25]|nr:hypothetical protein [Shewanella shenzhenensis]